MTLRLVMAEESIFGVNELVKREKNEAPRAFIPTVDQDRVLWAVREVTEESESVAPKPTKQKPISHDRRLALLKSYKASSVARASNIDWQLLTGKTNGFDSFRIERVINEA